VLCPFSLWIVSATTAHRMGNETVKALLEHYPIWRYPDFQRLIQYPALTDPLELRQEMVKLRDGPKNGSRNYFGVPETPL
jgi:hypothetical protein